MKRILEIAVAAIVLISLIPATSLCASNSLTVNLYAKGDAVKAGDTIAVNVNFSAFPNVTRFGPIEVSFDPSYVSFTGMDKGSAMPSTFTLTNTASTSLVSIAGVDQTVEAQVAANQTAPTADSDGNPVAPPVDPSMHSDSTVTVCVLYFKVLDSALTGQAMFALQNLGGFRDSSMNQVAAGAGSSATVPVQSVLSSNAALSSLSLDGVDITPAFSPSVFQYSAKVTRAVSSVKVTASAQDPTATVTISGADNLLVGDNKIAVKVAAQDGKTAVEYTIQVTRDASFVPQGAEITDAVSGTKYTFAELPATLTPPFGFTQDAREVGGLTVPVFTGAGVKSLLLYLQNGDSAPDFYQYNPDTGAIRPFLATATLYRAASLYTITKVTSDVSVPAGYTESVVKIDDISMPCYVKGDKTLVFLTDEAGISSFYLVGTDGSLHPYQIPDQVQDFFVPFLITLVVAVAELLMIIVVVRQVRRHNRPKEVRRV